MQKADGEEVGSSKGRATGEQLVGDAAECILIRLFTQVALELFRGHITRCASTAHIFNTGRTQHRRNAKVGQQSLSSHGKENIFWFEVAVDNVLFVRIVQGLPNLGENSQGFLHGKELWSIRFETVAERTIRGIFCDQIRAAIIYPDIKNGQDIGMLEHFKELSLAEKILALFLRAEVQRM